MASVADIEGIGPKYAEKLKTVGVTTTDKLLEKGASKKGRAEIADLSGIDEKLILKWVNHADLFRVKGVAGQYAELLEAAGIDTVAELAQRKPENLLAIITKTNETKKLVRSLPDEKSITGWIAEAKSLPRRVEY